MHSIHIDSFTFQFLNVKFKMFMGFFEFNFLRIRNGSRFTGTDPPQTPERTGRCPQTRSRTRPCSWGKG